MSAAIDQLKQEFRDYITAGVPSSGEYKPKKANIRDGFTKLDVQLSNVALSGFADITKDTRANLDADLAHDADTIAFVYGDPDTLNNEYYLKTDITGFGTWERLDILHAAFAAIVAEEIQPIVDGSVLQPTEENRVAILDAGGQAIFSIDETGTATFEPSDAVIGSIAERLPGALGAAPPVYSAIPAPANLITFYGQSLSLGLAAAGTLSGPSAYANAEMPDSGVQDATWTDGGSGLTGYASLATALVPLDASVNAHGIEAPVVGAVNQLTYRMAYAEVIASNAGRGAYSLAGLGKGYDDGGGGGPYDLLIDQYATYSGLLGAKPLRTTLCWMQGETDAESGATTIAGYKAGLLALLADYKADTGQPDVHLVVYQLSSHTMRAPGYNPAPGLALSQLNEERADVSLALPMYFLDYTDGVHINAASARLCGAYFGKAIDHYFATGTKFSPLRPSKITRVGTEITVEFSVPVGNLVVDTEMVSDPGDLGFEVFDSVGGAVLPISSVYVYGNRAVLTLAGVPANPVEVGYALGSTLNGQLAGAMTGARGCLRDEDSTPAYFDTATRLYNFCVMFRKAEGYGV